MKVVDSCGWLEAFAGSPLGRVYLEALRDVPEVLVPSLCVHEVCRVIARQRGEDEALTHVARMLACTVVPLDSVLAVEAARAGVMHRLPLADSITYATARHHHAELWTHDAHFRGLPGVRFVDASAPK